MLTVSLQLHAVPAPKRPIQAQQPDGSTVTIRIYGDEHYSWTATTDGYSIARNKAGYFEYVSHIDNDTLTVLSGIRVNNVEKRGAQEQTFLQATPKQLRAAPVAKQLEANTTGMQRNQSANAADGMWLTRTPQSYFSKQKSLKTIVVPVHFPDYPLTYSQEEIDRALNGVNYTGHGFKGSVRDYFHDMSGGQFTYESTVLPPYTAKLSRIGGYASRNNSYGATLAEEVTEYIYALLNEKAISEYDSNDDGIIDHISIIYAGQGQDLTGNTGMIWPNCQWQTGYSARIREGIIYTLIPEIDNFDNNFGIATYCHEFGHVLRLPDLYDSDYANNGLSDHPADHDIMASNTGTGHPVSLSAFSRFSLGWLNLKTVGTATNLSLPDIDTQQQALRINTTTPGEFFVLENRLNQKWYVRDIYEAHGLLVFRVDSTQYRSQLADNMVNAYADRLGYEVIRADNNSSYDSQGEDYFPWSARSFTDQTTPSMKSRAGANTGKPITDITASNGRISFNLMGGGNPLIVSTHSITSSGNGKVTVKASVLLPGNDLCTERGVCWGMLPTPTISGNKQAATDTNADFEVEVSGLTPGTSYYFRAYAMKSDGVPVYGAAKMCTAERVIKVTTEYGTKGDMPIFDISEMQNPVLEIYKSSNYSISGTYGNHISIYNAPAASKIRSEIIDCASASGDYRQKNVYELPAKSNFYRIATTDYVYHAEYDSIVIKEKTPVNYLTLPYAEKNNNNETRVIQLNTLTALQPVLHLKGISEYYGNYISVKYKTGNNDYQYLEIIDSYGINYRKAQVPCNLHYRPNTEFWNADKTFTAGDYFVELPRAEDLTLYIDGISELYAFDNVNEGIPLLADVAVVTASAIEVKAIVYNRKSNDEVGICWYPQSGAANINNKITLTGQGSFTHGFSGVPNERIYVNTYKKTGETITYGVPVLLPVRSTITGMPAVQYTTNFISQPQTIETKQNAPTATNNTILFTATYGDIDFSEWTLVPAGTFDEYNTTDLITPELNLSGLSNPALFISSGNAISISVSTDGNTFTDIVGGGTIPLAKNVKFIKIHKNEWNWGTGSWSSNFSITIDESPVITAPWQYTFDENNLTGWQTLPTPVFHRENTTDLITPELDLSGLTNPALSVSGNAISLSVSTDGNTFTNIVGGGTIPLAKNVKFIKIHKDEWEWGTDSRYSNFSIAIDEKPIITAPYQYTFDANNLIGWQTLPTLVFHRDDTRELIAPELDLSGFNEPCMFISVRSGITAAVSSDGNTYTNVPLNSTITLAKNIKYIKFHLLEESWGEYEKFTLTVIEKPKIVCPVKFAYTEDTNLIGWEVSPAGAFSRWDIRSLTTPELDLSGLEKPMLYINSHNSNIIASVSADGNNYTQVATNARVPLNTNTKYIKFNSTNGDWGNNGELNFIIANSYDAGFVERSVDNPIEVIDYRDGIATLRVWYDPAQLVGAQAQGICWNQGEYYGSDPTISDNLDYIEGNVQEIRYFTINLSNVGLIRPFILQGSGAVYDKVMGINQKCDDNVINKFLDKTVNLPYNFINSTTDESKYWKGNVPYLYINHNASYPADNYFNTSSVGYNELQNYSDTLFLQSPLINQQGARNPQVSFTVRNDNSANGNFPVTLYAVNSNTGEKRKLTSFVPSQSLNNQFRISTKGYGDEFYLRFEMPKLVTFSLSQFEIKDDVTFLTTTDGFERETPALVKLRGHYQPESLLPGVTEAGFVYSLYSNPLKPVFPNEVYSVVGEIKEDNTIEAFLPLVDASNLHIATYVKNAEGYSYGELYSDFLQGEYIVRNDYLPATDYRSINVYTSEGYNSDRSANHNYEIIEGGYRFKSGILNIDYRPTVNKIQATVTIQFIVPGDSWLINNTEELNYIFTLHYRQAGSMELQSLPSELQSIAFARAQWLMGNPGGYLCTYEAVMQLPRDIEQIYLDVDTQGGGITLNLQEYSSSHGISIIQYIESNVQDFGCVPPAIEGLTVNNGQLDVQWSISDMRNVSKVQLYRESTTAGSYTLLHEYPANHISAGYTYTYTDNTANPASRAYQYRILSANSDGAEFIGTQHKSVHLSINKGILDQWNLYWTPYEGFNVATVRIYRGTSSSSLSYLDEVPGTNNTYTDVSAPSGTLYYVVETVFSASSPAPMQRAPMAAVSSRSNVISNLDTSVETIQDSEISVYPNPAKDYITINANGRNIETIRIISISGTVIKDEQYTSGKINVSQLPEGIYFISIKTTDGEYRQRFIKN
jgi:M6 family metalloprotease domain